MIFIDNKYTYIYNSIINKAKSRNFLTKTEAKSVLGYVEIHHIIPKSLRGTNEKENLVFLTAREHFVCHWLLVKMTKGIDKEKMIFALNGMRRNSRNHNRYETVITAKVYENYRQEMAKILSIKNKGNKWNQTEESKAKISKGNTGKIRDDIFRSKVSAVHKNKIETEETKLKKSLSHKGKKHSIETLKKLSDNSGRSVSIFINGNFYKSKKLAAAIEFPNLPYHTAIRMINKKLAGFPPTSGFHHHP